MTNNSLHRSVFQHLTREEMIRYKTGRLDAADKNTIEKHLAECTLCRDAVSGLSKMDELTFYRILRSLHQIRPRRKGHSVFSSHEKLIWLSAVLISAMIIGMLVAYFLMTSK